MNAILGQLKLPGKQHRPEDHQPHDPHAGQAEDDRHDIGAPLADETGPQVEQCRDQGHHSQIAQAPIGRTGRMAQGDQRRHVAPSAIIRFQHRVQVLLGECDQILAIGRKPRRQQVQRLARGLVLLKEALAKL